MGEMDGGKTGNEIDGRIERASTEVLCCLCNRMPLFSL